MVPGACCRMMHLTGSEDRISIGPMSRERAEHMALRFALPFIPALQLESGEWLWACTQLQADGRCGIYESRPELCRNYVEGSDPLCVHHWSEEGLTEERGSLQK